MRAAPGSGGLPAQLPGRVQQPHNQVVREAGAEALKGVRVRQAPIACSGALRAVPDCAAICAAALPQPYAAYGPRAGHELSTIATHGYGAPTRMCAMLRKECAWP
jgi:hypothetical protein